MKERKFMIIGLPCLLIFGSPAILGHSGSLPWLLEGSEDPWLAVPAFKRVWFCLKKKIDHELRNASEVE
jgi:hypothetical protein